MPASPARFRFPRDRDRDVLGEYSPELFRDRIHPLLALVVLAGDECDRDDPVIRLAVYRQDVLEVLEADGGLDEPADSGLVGAAEVPGDVRRCAGHDVVPRRELPPFPGCDPGRPGAGAAGETIPYRGGGCRSPARTSAGSG